MANAKPTHALFFVQDITAKGSDDKKDKWTRIGSGWEVKEGRINVKQEFTPLGDGNIQLVPVELLKKKD